MRNKLKSLIYLHFVGTVYHAVNCWRCYSDIGLVVNRIQALESITGIIVGFSNDITFRRILWDVEKIKLSLEELRSLFASEIAASGDFQITCFQNHLLIQFLNDWIINPLCGWEHFSQQCYYLSENFQKNLIEIVEVILLCPEDAGNISIYITFVNELATLELSNNIMPQEESKLVKLTKPLSTVSENLLQHVIAIREKKERRSNLSMKLNNINGTHSNERGKPILSPWQQRILRYCPNMQEIILNSCDYDPVVPNASNFELDDQTDTDRSSVPSTKVTKKSSKSTATKPTAVATLKCTLSDDSAPTAASFLAQTRINIITPKLLNTKKIVKEKAATVEEFFFWMEDNHPDISTRVLKPVLKKSQGNKKSKSKKAAQLKQLESQIEPMVRNIYEYPIDGLVQLPVDDIIEGEVIAVAISSQHPTPISSNNTRYRIQWKDALAVVDGDDESDVEHKGGEEEEEELVLGSISEHSVEQFHILEDYYDAYYNWISDSTQCEYINSVVAKYFTTDDEEDATNGSNNKFQKKQKQQQQPQPPHKDYCADSEKIENAFLPRSYQKLFLGHVIKYSPYDPHDPSQHPPPSSSPTTVTTTSKLPVQLSDEATKNAFALFHVSWEDNDQEDLDYDEYLYHHTLYTNHWTMQEEATIVEEEEVEEARERYKEEYTMVNNDAEEEEKEEETSSSSVLSLNTCDDDECDKSENEIDYEDDENDNDEDVCPKRSRNKYNQMEKKKKIALLQEEEEEVSGWSPEVILGTMDWVATNDLFDPYDIISTTTYDNDLMMLNSTKYPLRSRKSIW